MTDGAPSRPGVQIDFGRQWLPAEVRSRLGPEAVVELDAPVDGSVEVYAGGRLRARGEPVVIDGKLCVRVREVGEDAEAAAPRRRENS